MPAVSVIVPTQNSEKTLQRTLSSLSQQSFKDFEVIVTDGLSEDSTLMVARSFWQLDIHIISEKDESMYDAINKGIRAASGQYILILNSDDWYYPRAIEILVTTQESSDNDMITSALADEYGYNLRFIRTIGIRPWNYGALLRMPLRHELMMVPKVLYKEHGIYDKNYKIAGDLDFCARIKSLDIKVKQIEMPLMGFRAGGIGYKLSERLIAERVICYRKIFSGGNDALFYQLAKDTWEYSSILGQALDDDHLMCRLLLLSIRDQLGNMGFYKDPGNRHYWNLLTESTKVYTDSQ